MTMKKNNLLLIPPLVMLLSACGFHLRGLQGDFKFPYQSVYLQCDGTVICHDFESAVKSENLAKVVTNKESADAMIIVSNEQTSRDGYGYNASGQLSSYLLTYQVAAQVFDRSGNQIGQTIVVQQQTVMAYNNSLILSAQQQEDKSWDSVHQAVISSLIRRIVYSHPYQASTNETESR